LTICSFVAGFSSNLVMRTMSRAGMELGTGAFLPAGAMLLGSKYPLDLERILSSAYTEPPAVAGFFIGNFGAGLVDEHG
jgi:MFS family permease